MKKFVVLVMTVGMVLVPAAASASAHTRLRRCVVPRLAGLTLKMARGRLTHAGCRVGIIHRPKAAAGDLVVGRQAPRAGHKTRGGSKVTIWLEAKHTSSANAPTPQTLITRDCRRTAWERPRTLRATWSTRDTTTSSALPHVRASSTCPASRLPRGLGQLHVVELHHRL